MNRRSFIKNTGVAGAGATFMLSGVPVRALSPQGIFQQAAANSSNDRVLIFIQLHGGNDGMNMLVPRDQYPMYYSHRPNLALPETGVRSIIPIDPSLPSNRQLGLHPDMDGLRQMYEQGRAAVIQNVSYPYANGSHFRSRDVWFMGGSYNDYFSSGWMGRYLDHEYPNYPDAYPNPQMEDPLAIEIGTGVSLAFHRDNGIPVGLSISDPIGFYNLINSVGGSAPTSLPDTHAGDELEYIMQIEAESNAYAGRLRSVFMAGSNSNVTYPTQYPYLAPQGSLNNPLAGQLKIIARLLSGGCKTRIFLCRIGGFDTHANQVEEFDTTMGHHAALMYHISEGVKAFYDDLQNLGLDQKVLTLTMSEFGRRVPSNGSFGTDHGNAQPLLAFGPCVNKDVFAPNPNLSALQGGNVPLGIDYRQIMATVVQDWFGASPSLVQTVGFSDWVGVGIPFVECAAVGIDNIKQAAMSLSPNPCSHKTTLRVPIHEAGWYQISIYSMQGRKVYERMHEFAPPVYSMDIHTGDWSNGGYVVHCRGGGRQFSQTLMVQH